MKRNFGRELLGCMRCQPSYYESEFIHEKGEIKKCKEGEKEDCIGKSVKEMGWVEMRHLENRLPQGGRRDR